MRKLLFVIKAFIASRRPRISKSERGPYCPTPGVNAGNLRPIISRCAVSNHHFAAFLPMKSKFLILILIMLSLLFGRRHEASAAEGSALAEQNNVFALDLYSRLKTARGNLFFSPYSISTALGMTYTGAHGNTAKQMANVFHFDSDPTKVANQFSQLQEHFANLARQPGVELNIANGLWAQQGYPFLPKFLNFATNQFSANLQHADFIHAAENARDEINNWVAEKTHKRIENILPPGSLHELTRLVLANAIYFKGAWAKPFDKRATSNQPFHLTAGHQIDVPLMYQLNNVRYMENPDFQAVELPYNGKQLSMLILLPRQIDGYHQLEQNFSVKMLASTLETMKSQQVELHIPRFRLESEVNLNDSLSALGMPDAFTDKADFSAMDGKIYLYISGVFHKAWGEVNEEGTEAAAATAVAVAARAIAKPPPPPPVFRADHPFLFLIRDASTGSILFIGRLESPAK